jgi:adenylate cyclase
MQDAEEMLQHLCIQPLIKKIRYHVEYDKHTWEVDVFAGKNEGLIVAEIELKSTNEAFTKPNWIGDEVSDDPRYYNVSLVSCPYENWTK